MILLVYDVIFGVRMVVVEGQYARVTPQLRHRARRRLAYFHHR